VWLFGVVVDSGRLATTTSWMLDVMLWEWFLVSGVINFGLGLVITLKRASGLEVVVSAACTLTTTSML